jgi:hypothetical protein
MSGSTAEHPGKLVTATRRLGNLALFRRDIPVENTKAAIGWWETRRIAYNLIVGGSGIVTCVVDLLIAAAAWIFFKSDFGTPNGAFAIFGVIFYGIMANLCFTCGWITELIVRRAWPDEADRFATTAFSLGLAFSVLLTLIPAIVLGTVGFFMLVSHVLRASH